jgi:uncharacterized protein (DUF58 family)
VDRDRLHDRIRRLLFASPALARAFARGDFRSVFRGRGIEFDSLRDYSPDDDARLIDFRATARLGRPFVRSYREDRSLTVFLVIDVSASMDQGSGELSKLDLGVLASSLVAYAAQFRGLPVGCLVFAATVLGRLAPRRGKAHALAVADAAAAIAASREAGLRKGSDLAGALRTTALLLKRRSLVLVLSDFRARGWERSMGELARRHDVVALRLSDRLDLDLPKAGAFEFVDPESGEAAWFPLASRRFRQDWETRGAEARDASRRGLQDLRVPVLELDTEDDPALRLLDFFERRRGN